MCEEDNTIQGESNAGRSDGRVGVTGVSQEITMAKVNMKRKKRGMVVGKHITTNLSMGTTQTMIATTIGLSTIPQPKKTPPFKNKRATK